MSLSVFNSARRPVLFQRKRRSLYERLVGKGQEGALQKRRATHIVMMQKTRMRVLSLRRNMI
mgnify:CR=1 FL=1